MESAWKVRRPLTENEESPFALDATHRLTLRRTAKATLTSVAATGTLIATTSEAELGRKYAKESEHPAMALRGVLTRLAPSN
jgi:hypothetical protein